MIDLGGKLLAGRYRLQSLIGHGGMADVYAGVDERLERAVAIKVLVDRSTEPERFLHEALAMAKLNHANIVGVYDAGQVDGVAYIVMELLLGKTLAEIAPSSLTIHTAIRYLIDLLEALAYAHERDVIHRDIKPANVMVLNDGSIKVMDFGLSRRTTEMSAVTSAGEIVGTIAYLAPERFLGKVADSRSDLYSVGVVMYEMFTGVVPFKNETDDLIAVIFAHVNDTPLSLRVHNRAVPLPIERIVLKLLEKDPARRYGSARELIAELRALIGASAGTAAESPLGASAMTAARAPDELRSALNRSFGGNKAHDTGTANTLAGMLATRKRDYPEAIRAYTQALATFKAAGDTLESAKTGLKYAAMMLQKNTEAERPNRREVDEALEVLVSCMPALRKHRLHKEHEEGERIHVSLQRIAARLR